MDQANVVLVGRMSADPKMFDEGTEKARAVFTIATNRGRGDNRKSSFIDCIAWGKRSEIMGDFKKGDGIFVTGDLEQDNYETKEGQKRSRVQVNVTSITATRSTRDNSGGGGNSAPAREASEEAPIPF